MVLAYYTPKVVAIQSNRLAILYYVSTIVVLIYVFVYEILLSQGYLQLETVTGHARLLVQGKPSDIASTKQLPYCSTSSSPSDTPTLRCQLMVRAAAAAWCIEMTATTTHNTGRAHASRAEHER